MPVARILRDEAVAQRVVEALRRRRVALELADDRAGVDVVDADQAAPLRDHAEADAVGLLAGVGAVAGAVEVQDHPVRARPLRHRLDRGVADGEVDHDDDRAELLRELGALVHLLHRPGGHVHVAALDLAGRGLGARDGLHHVAEAVAPAHERLRVDVLVVLREVEAAAERLVDDAAVVLGREAELRLDGRAEDRAAELVEVLALHHDPVRGALERLDVVRAGCACPRGAAT